MLLIITNRDDLTADWLVLELERRDTSFVRFNTEEFPGNCSLTWGVHGGARIGVADCKIDLNEVRSVWYRRPGAPQLPAGLGKEDRAWATREASALLDGLWATIDAQWVSHPAAIRTASSKLRQLRDAAALGFDVPDTEITNDPNRLRALWERAPHGVICKALSDGRVRGDREGALLYTTPIVVDMIDGLGPEPHLFQAQVAKTYDLRVTVIGTETFTTRIDAGGNVDWRTAPEADLSYTKEDLPGDVADRCRALVKGYGLAFGAIDLARRPDGGYTFFELNPNGQWAWIEQRTGAPLRACLADLLLAQ